MAWRGRQDDDDSADDSADEFDEDSGDDCGDEFGDDLDADADLRDDDSADEPTIDCPACGAEMLEDSPRCPACGEYVAAAEFQPASRPLWVIVTAAVCLAIAVWMALAGF